MASAQSDDGQVVLRIGLTQDWDSLNPTAGFLVSEYEIWNLHYATLTDKAADDFAIQPGLAESWEVSDDGLTVTYTLRENLTWSDGTPLTADDVAWNVNTSVEQGWQNHISTTQNLTAEAVDERTVRGHLLGSRSQASDSRHLPSPPPHLGANCNRWRSDRQL